MEKIVLKDEVLSKIKSNGTLFGAIATVLNISPSSLPRLLINNDSRLTQADVLRILKSHLKIKNDKDLFTRAPVAA